MTALFITATGTGLGKTVVTAALAHQLIAQNRAVRALKPVISGFDAADPDSDTAILLRALGRPVSAEWIAAISPWRFAAPLSPDMAAAREGRRIEPRTLARWCRVRIAECDGLTLIEGVGGAFVPLDGDYLVADWIADLGCPSLLVTGSYLGTLSHTIAAVEAMAARDIAPAGLIVSASEEEPVPIEETTAALERRLRLPAAILPRLAGPDPWTGAPDLTDLLGRM